MKSKKTILVCLLIFFIPIIILSCDNKRGQGEKQQQKENSNTEEKGNNQSPFSPDSAYFFIEKQLSFGARVPNSAAHNNCKKWIVSKLQQYGAHVIEQNASVKSHSGEDLNITNIIASYNPDVSKRILLLAHWDTRPVADQDENPSKKNQPIPGADDGGSGVALLMEIARIMQLTSNPLGVDLLFVDAEDSGVENKEDSWCLGSTYWSKNPHIPNYKAEFAILLDMVGAQGAEFRWEYYSKNFAPNILSMVWQAAADLGYGQYFVQADGAALTDDHVPIIKNLGIPTIDIVNYSPKNTKGFGPHWHTMKDNIHIIDKEVLRAVGETVWKVITEEEK